MEVKQNYGYVGAFGDLVDQIAQEALQHPVLQGRNFKPVKGPYHITLISPPELKKLKGGFEFGAFRKLLEGSEAQITPIGVGGVSNSSRPVLFVVITWVAAQLARKAVNLPTKQFHITLTADDDHSIDKGVDSILHGAFPENPSAELLDRLVHSLILEGRTDRAEDVALRLCEHCPHCPKGYVRLADLGSRKERWKLAMLSYGQALNLTEPSDEKIQKYCLKKLLRCAEETEWGSLLIDDELAETNLPRLINLCKPWSTITRDLIADALQEVHHYRPKSLDSRIRFILPLTPITPITPNTSTELPRFFRWLIPFHFALMSTPRSASDITLLGSPHIGIKHIITLTQEAPLPSEWFRGTGVEHTFLPIENFKPPSIEQMDIILNLFTDKSKLPILVHCGGGKGRAGTVAACYLVAYGFARPQPDQAEPRMQPSEAISVLRVMRPGSIETDIQEEFVHTWCSALWKRHSILPEPVREPPPSAPEITGKVNAAADLVVLVGLPGSGKSTFATALMERSDLWRRISQDDSGAGGRAACEADIGRRGSAKVILDRCNPSPEDRKYWMNLAVNWAQNPVAIVFDFPADLCISRAQRRPDHPTLPPSGRVRAAVAQAKRLFEMPSLREGFEGVAIVRSFEAADEVLRKLSPAGLFKFPRTPHLLDLGAATTDDIQTPVSTTNVNPSPYNRVVITEKIDGANLGFSLDANRSVVVQNRSHFVNSASHEQFKKLGLWVERHREELYAVLDRDPSFPERYILFGEWLAATHSIPYTHLPDLFIAFDLYDRRARSYATYNDLQSLLQPHGIHIVPLIDALPESEMPSESQLRQLVQTPSKFYDGPVEGAYLKVESIRENKIIRRSKVVRGDFISGDEHWTRGQVRWNGIVQGGGRT